MFSFDLSSNEKEFRLETLLPLALLSFRHYKPIIYLAVVTLGANFSIHVLLVQGG